MAGKNNPWIPIADLLSGFVVVILMMFVASASMKTLEAMSEAEEREAERVETMQTLAKKLAVFVEQGVLRVDIQERLIELREVSFTSGSACLSEGAEEAVDAISDDVVRILDAQPNLLVYVEGHTDPVPVGALRSACGYFADNTQLSSVRAANVKVRLLGGRHDALGARVPVSGWGPAKLRNEDEPTAPENRRVEIRFVWADHEKESQELPED